MKITITPGIKGRKLNENELVNLVSYLILTPENSTEELRNWEEIGLLPNYKGYKPKRKGESIVIEGPAINPYDIFSRIIEENKGDIDKPRYSIMHSKIEYEEWPSIPHWEALIT